MSQSTLELLEYDEQMAKRASWEAFEFTLLGEGVIEVVNGSYDDPREHTYMVHAEGKIPSDCTCPAWEYQEGACKHMVAVAIREPLLEAVATEPSTRADGGIAVEAPPYDDSEEECDCDKLSDDFPCWPCVPDGRREL
ncbi:SWIM zinc finger family protein [Natrinema halophilum]|uniref:SWIM zinc finger family protein n=1 Tax=Natrinema halophilum TaxID=1699371 RepID=A0A7D5L020_9EURY|nr:SWIM zinc finger family protein [Natrinema halophilum]QLG50680.1 SWIM zinc finger domain-containing protein [Natrinema halophilum]